MHVYTLATYWKEMEVLKNSSFVCLPINSFFVIFLLLHFENVSDKKLLQVFIAVIDAHLFKAVLFKCFKPKDIQYSN